MTAIPQQAGGERRERRGPALIEGVLMGDVYSLIRMYWECRCVYQWDTWGASYALSGIRPTAAKILESAGIEWKQPQEDHLVSAVLNYSKTLKRPFWKYYAERYRHCFVITREQAEAITRAARQADDKEG